MTFPRRGEIYLVEFDPSRDHEIQKTRPAVVIQNDLGNQYSSVTIVAAITWKQSPTLYPIEVAVAPGKRNGLALPSAVLLGQIRTVDRQLLIKRLGVLEAITMRRIDEALKICLGLNLF